MGALRRSRGEAQPATREARYATVDGARESVVAFVVAGGLVDEAIAVASAAGKP